MVNYVVSRSECVACFVKYYCRDCIECLRRKREVAV
jgi:hypothetical protein